MTYAIGQLITDVITVRDLSNAPVLGLEEDDFVVFEAYLVSTPASTELVAIEEIDGGQYSIEFNPGLAGVWAFHYVYDVNPVFREETRTYIVDSTAEIVTVSSGGTWTYEGDLEDPIQEVRFLIQDTDASHPEFTDNEISYALGRASDSARRAAIALVERLLVRYSKMADTTELDLSVRASQLYENAQQLLIQLKSGGVGAIPYAGGISYSDIEANNSSGDRVRGVFDKDYPSRFSRYGGIY